MDTFIACDCHCFIQPWKAVLGVVKPVQKKCLRNSKYNEAKCTANYLKPRTMALTVFAFRIHAHIELVVLDLGIAHIFNFPICEIISEHKTRYCIIK